MIYSYKRDTCIIMKGKITRGIYKGCVADLVQKYWRIPEKYYELTYH